MPFDFDRIYDRSLNNAAKFEEMEMRFGRSDLIPLWVADMDFPSPEPVTAAIVNRAEQGIFGYTARPEAYYEAMIGWYREKHDWEINPQWVIHSPAVVMSLSMLVEKMTAPGDDILIQSPVYNPFYDVIRGRGRRVVENHLIREGLAYRVDYEDLDLKLATAKLFILCNPHNPVGRVWQKEELERIGALCLKHGVRVISDEIHADFVFAPNRYIPFASLSEEVANLTITCLSATKTFNIAGLQASFVIFPIKEEWQAFDQALGLLDIRRNNCFSLVAVEAAFLHGEAWLEALMTYLAGNIRFVQRFLAQEIPEIISNDPEGTYLLWLDCSSLGMSDSELHAFMINEAKVAMGAGTNYGPKGSGFMRMNVACSQQVLGQALERIRDAVVRKRMAEAIQ